jgi:hypothetical protein
MLIDRRVQLLSPILASKANNRGTVTRREFARIKSTDGKVHIKSDLARWNWAFLEARDALGLSDVAVSAILPAHSYVVNTTSTYHRTFRRGRGEQLKEAFESLPAGHVVTWQFTLSQHVPPGGGSRFTRAPSGAEFDSMLTHIGENLGMSEWGHAYLYGRFTIKHNYELPHIQG